MGQRNSGISRRKVRWPARAMPCVAHAPCVVHAQQHVSTHPACRSALFFSGSTARMGAGCLPPRIVAHARRQRHPAGVTCGDGGDAGGGAPFRKWQERGGDGGGLGGGPAAAAATHAAQASAVPASAVPPIVVPSAAPTAQAAAAASRITSSAVWRHAQSTGPCTDSGDPTRAGAPARSPLP